MIPRPFSEAAHLAETKGAWSEDAVRVAKCGTRHWCRRHPKVSAGGVFL